MNLNDIFEKIRIGYFWMFLTEKCNLNCEYCFYREKDYKSTASFEMISNTINALPIWNQPEFVFSGGEPLIEYELIKKIVPLIKSKFKNPYILILTNALLLDKEKIDYIKKENIYLEVGLDGKSKTTTAHRFNVNETNYDLIKNNIKNAIDAGIKVSCTMTVHPSEVDYSKENFMELNKIGFDLIEMTPASFEKWDPEKNKRYIENYLAVIEEMKKIGKIKVLSTIYDRPIQNKLDVGITAKEMILPSWASFGLPKDVKEEYAYFSNRKVNTNVLYRILSKQEKLFQKDNVTYRELSTIHVKDVEEEWMKKGQNHNFEYYSELNDEIKRIVQNKLINV